MSDPMTNVDIEDVLASIRRLVSEDARPRPTRPAPVAAAARDATRPAARPRPETAAGGAPDAAAEPALLLRGSLPPAAAGRLVLTPSLRVMDQDGADVEQASAPQPAPAAQPQPAQPWQDPAARLADLWPDDPDEFDAPDGARDQTADAPDQGDNGADDGGASKPAAENAASEQHFDPDIAATLQAAVTGSDIDMMTDRVLQALGQSRDRADGSADNPEAVAGPDPVTLAENPAPAQSPSEPVFSPAEPDLSPAEQDLSPAEPVLQWEDHHEADTVTANVDAQEAMMHDQPPPASDAAHDAAHDSASQDDTGQHDAGQDDMPDQSHADGTAPPSADHARFDDDLADRRARDDSAAILADDTIIDEAMLRDMVADIVRQELMGALGERITRNVRKLVRREIHRALSAQEFD